ncbi:MAG TPA: DNA polymerase Y family protein, partial [Acidimicrobiales bacterium]|nr:DNA polymerase Y family protein [Acidimicrobiales bacterium]
MALWCPDWPVRAGGADPAAAVAVVKANRVVAASAPARAEGVEVGQRRRQAESRCPGLAVVQLDEGRDARAFEPVVQAVSAFAPRVEVVRPGEAAFAVRGPARYFGGERRLGRLVADAADAASPGGPGGGPPCRVGVADGPFAAALAARRGIVVPAGATPRFLAPLPVEAMGLPDLADLLVRLGIRTLGQLGELPSTQVLSRFGPEGERAHRLARGLDERLLDARPPAEDLAVVVELDPPVERVDAAAFAAKTAADRLHACMQERGLVCAQVAIEAESEHGERLSR